MDKIIQILANNMGNRLTQELINGLCASIGAEVQRLKDEAVKMAAKSGVSHD